MRMRIFSLPHLLIKATGSSLLGTKSPEWITSSGSLSVATISKSLTSCKRRARSVSSSKRCWTRSHPIWQIYPAHGELQLQLCQPPPDAHPLPDAEGHVGKRVDGAVLPQPALRLELLAVIEVVFAGAQSVAVYHQHRLQEEVTFKPPWLHGRRKKTAAVQLLMRAELQVFSFTVALSAIGNVICSCMLAACSRELSHLPPWE